jgi:hypothetical protein
MFETFMPAPKIKSDPVLLAIVIMARGRLSLVALSHEERER